MRNAFKKGVWFAVEYLIIERGEDVYANELIKEAGISQKEAEAILQETQYEAEKLKSSLKIFQSPHKVTDKEKND